MKRCRWVNMNNPIYIEYHDHEWGILNLDDHYLFEMLILEMFQAGLSFECILNKRESFREAFADFDVHRVAEFMDDDVTRLMSDSRIIRNRLKIKAAINNAKIFLGIAEEYGSFKDYLLTFTGDEVIVNDSEIIPASSSLSDSLSKDLRKRGMTFVGTVIIYSYLQAIGIINDHERDCSFNPLNKKQLQKC